MLLQPIKQFVYIALFPGDVNQLLQEYSYIV